MLTVAQGVIALVANVSRLSYFVRTTNRILVRFSGKSMSDSGSEIREVVWDTYDANSCWISFGDDRPRVGAGFAVGDLVTPASSGYTGQLYRLAFWQSITVVLLEGRSSLPVENGGEVETWLHSPPIVTLHSIELLIYIYTYYLQSATFYGHNHMKVN